MKRVHVWYTVAEAHEDTVEVTDDYGQAEVQEALWQQHPFADEIDVQDYEAVDG